MKRILMFVVSICIGTALADEFVLIDKGESDYVIAIPSSASKYERFAAGELALHLEKMAGIKLAVAEEDTLEPGKKVISIGGTSFSKKAGIDRSKLQDEEIVIRTTAEGNLILSGGRLRGTMYAVYDFLEKQLGCHWFDEYTFAIPEKKRIAIPELNLQYRPYFMFRRVSASIPVDRTAWQIFILRNQGSDDPYLCGYDLIGSPIACHSFEYYAKNFPEGDVEFYAMNEKGIRQKPAGSSGPDFCLTNPGVIKNVTASLKKYILQDRARYAQYGFPPPLIYDISQNDGSQGWYCLCPACKKTIEKYGAQSGLLLDFINQIADNIKDEFPDVYIQTFAYNQGNEPPKGIVPRDNVLIRYCTTIDIFGAPFDAPANKSLQKQLEGWSRISKHMGIWLYTYFFLDPFAMPYVSANQFGKDFKYLADNNVKTVYVENHDYYKLSFFALQRWLAYQLMQDPRRDADKLIKTFMDGYYGGAAGAMTEYYHYLAKLSGTLTCSIFSEEGKTIRPYLTAEFFRKADALLEEAEKACEPESRQLLNVHRERAIVDSAYLNLREKLGDLPLDENVVLDRYEKYRMELLDTLVSEEGKNGILAKIKNDVRKLRFGKAITKAVKNKKPGEFSVPKVTDNDWNKARVISDWSENYGLPTQKQLTARLMHDGENLKIRLKEDHIDRELLDGPGEVWSGDDWELHFTGDSAEGNLRMIAISPKRSRALEVGRKPGGMPNGETSPLTEYAARADSKIEGNSWTVEVVIPLDRLIPGGKVEAGGKIYMNMFRSAAHLGSAQAWNPTFQDSFHIPWRLGKVWIQP